MAQKIFNEYSKRKTVAFWIAITIGLVLFACLMFLLINYTAALF
jgi:succinate dehydrogenase hydrophobic anchor subunit